MNGNTAAFGDESDDIISRYRIAASCHTDHQIVHTFYFYARLLVLAHLACVLCSALCPFTDLVEIVQKSLFFLGCFCMLFFLVISEQQAHQLALQRSTVGKLCVQFIRIFIS